MSYTRVKRGYSRYFVFAVLICSALAGLGWFAYGQMKQWSYFAIDDIVITGNKNLSATFLQERVDDFKGQNILSLTSDEVATRFENIVRIKGVQIYRHYPRQLEVAVQEREAVLFVKTADGALLPVDKEKVVLDTSEFYESDDLPIVDAAVDSTAVKPGELLADDNLDRILPYHLKLVELEPQISSMVSEYYLENNAICIVESTVGTKIIFGENNLEEKIARLKFLRDNQQCNNAFVYDFRYKDQIIERPVNVSGIQ